jgi:nucleolar protein 4
MLLTAHTHKDASAHVQALNGATVHSLVVAYQTEFDKHQKQQEFLSKKQAKTGDKALLLENKTNQLEGLDVTKPRKEKLVVRTAAQVTPEEQRKRKCRLIVRNLSFLATEQNLLDKMSKLGPVVSVELPKKVVEPRDSKEGRDNGKGGARRHKETAEGPQERSMGFGFVTFLCESDAQTAVSNSSNLKVCNREVAVDFCMSKETYEKYGKKQDETSVTEAAADGNDDAVKDVGEEGSVDADDDSAGGSDGEGESDDGSMADDVDDVEGSDDDDEEQDEDSEAEGSDSEGSDQGEESGDEGKEGSTADALEKTKKEPSEDVHEGCTVFVRGLPFDAEALDLKRALGRFGRIALAIVVKDKETDISKGSAFVKFHQPDWAAACVAEAALHGGITIKDRLCKIDLAVDRQSAKSIKDSEMAKRGKDKRNLYLANEGLILPGAEDAHESHAAGKGQSMSEADKEKRQRAQTEKRKKLQNPLFFVSATRLSIRNLSKTITDKELRELCVDAVNAGLKKGLVKRADMEAYRLAQGSDSIIQQLQQQGTYKPNMDLDTVPPAASKRCLKTCKIMLDMQRIRGGAPQSRGYGFAEFTHHAYALACLRELNNNAQYSSHHGAGGTPGAGEAVGGKLIVELSLENIQKVQLFA